MMTLITKDLLISLKACKKDIEIFEEVFPQGTEITPESLALAHKMGLDVVWLAEQKLPADALAALAKDPNLDVRRTVAHNPFTPVKILTGLARDPDSDVRLEVAWNESTPTSILAALAKDWDPWVRCGVAKNPNTLETNLNAFIRDPDLHVRAHLAENPNITTAIHERLLHDEYFIVRFWASKRTRQTP